MNSSQPRTTPHPAWAIVPICLFAANALWHWAYTMDDAFIFLRFGENLAAGHGYAFNAGQTIEGTTSILWTLVAAALAKIGLVGPGPLKGVGLLAGSATVWAVSRQSLGARGGWGPIAAAIALAAYVPFAILSVSGMETPLAALCVFLGVSLAGGDAAGRRRWGALFLAAAFLTRPDAALFWALPLGLWLGDVIRRHEFKARLEPVLWLVATLVAVTAWRWSIFGEIFPNPARIKAASSLVTAKQGLDMMTSWLGAQAFVLPAAAAAIACVASVIPRTHALVAALFAVYLVAIGQENMSTFYRFHMPLVPVVMAMAGAGVDALWVAQPRFRWAVVAANVVFIACAPAIAAKYATKPLSEFELTVTTPEYARGVNETYRDFGEELASIAPPGALVASMDIGAIGYYSRRPILDLYGLTDKTIADIFRAMKGTADRSEQRRLYRSYADYVFSKKPDFFVDTVILKIIKNDERFAGCYRTVELKKSYIFDPRNRTSVGLFRRTCP